MPLVKVSKLPFKNGILTLKNTCWARPYEAESAETLLPFSSPLSLLLGAQVPRLVGPGESVVQKHSQHALLEHS